MKMIIQTIRSVSSCEYNSYSGELNELIILKWLLTPNDSRTFIEMTLDNLIEIRLPSISLETLDEFKPINRLNFDQLPANRSLVNSDKRACATEYRTIAGTFTAKPKMSTK